MLRLFLLLLMPWLLGATSTSLDLTWINQDTQSPAPTFLVERGPDGIIWTQIAETAAGVTAYTDGGLTPSTTYYYRIRAHNSAGFSAYSNVAFGTTTTSESPPNAATNAAVTTLTAQ